MGRVVVQDIHALRDPSGPLFGVADDRSATCTGAMTGIAGYVVNLRPRHDCRDRIGFSGSFDGRSGCFLLFARQVHLPYGSNTLGDGCLELYRITRIHPLCQVGHFHRKYEERKCDRRNDADYKGIHIKEFLVPTQMLLRSLRCLIAWMQVQAGGGRLYYSASANASSSQ